MKYIKIFFILLFAYILFNIEYHDFFININNIEVIYLLSAFLLNFPLFLLKTARWDYILKNQNIFVSFKALYSYYFSAVFVGIVTPGKIGEFSKVLYLKAKNHLSFGWLFSSVFLDRLFDLYMLLILSIVALYILGLTNLTLSVLLLAVFTISHLLLINSKWMKKATESLLRRISTNYRLRTHTFIADFMKASATIFSYRKILFLSLLTVSAYMIFFIQVYLLGVSIGITMDFFYLSLIISLSNLISLLPVSISGLGTRELVLLYFLSGFNFTTEEIVGFSLLILLACNIGSAVIGLLFFTGNKLELKKIKKGIIK